MNRQQRRAESRQGASFDHAVALHQAGHLAEAERLYRAVIAARPRHAQAHNNLGAALKGRAAYADAARHFRAAVAADPAYAAAHSNLGATLTDLGQPEAAIAPLERAIALAPDWVTPHSHLATALTDLKRPEAALAAHRRALALAPDRADTIAGLGRTLHRQRRLDEAIACYRAALERRPDIASTQYNLALALLAQGAMAEGWRAYEWRWQTARMGPQRRHQTVPQWRGAPGAGQTLLIHAEQGFGDTLQFCRYAPVAASRGLRVILEVPRALVRLLQPLEGVAAVVAQGEALPPFDLQCPMLSLPLACGTTPDTIPAPAALHVDPAAARRWQARLAGDTLRVGLAWAGGTASEADRDRSMDPVHLAPLLDTAGVRFVSLQKDGPRPAATAGLIDVMAEMTDFADTAALISQLDLVITVDTAVLHLAASLGRPVWLLDRFDHCWRWLDGRDDSPWYPTLRIFRQAQPDDWGQVVRAITAELKARALPWTRQDAARPGPAFLSGGLTLVRLSGAQG